jgi:type II secretory pathway predicted ATPase ExeA
VYESFFGLNDKPFSLTPNPRYVFYSQQYREAEGQLLYGINNREGFMLVTGQPGTGKTTLCRDLIEKLDHHRVHSALIFNPFLNAHEMLGALLSEFGISAVQHASRKELLDRLNQFLLAQLVLGNSCVAIFDEAQHLSTEFLEQIRVLSNLETDQEKLLQIVLVGQPELLDKIRTPGMAQLDQRVSIRCRLTYLDEQETDRYIHHRLNVAGGRGQVRFDPKAVSDIYRNSTGVPRLINLVTDRALLAAYTEQSRDILPAHVKKAVRALRGEEPEIARASHQQSPVALAPPRQSRWRVALLAALVLVLAGGAAAATFWQRQTPDQLAEALYWRGAMPRSSADGEGAFRELVENYPTSPRVPVALLGLAQYQAARGDRNGALQIYRHVIDRFPNDSSRARAFVLSAMVQLDSGDTVAACRSLASTDSLVVADRFLVSKMEQIGALCPGPAPVSVAVPTDTGQRVDTAAAHRAERRP